MLSPAPWSCYVTCPSSFLRGYGVLGHLHSFPTRRSSDLRNKAAGRPPQAAAASAFSFLISRPRNQETERDRKSTRLNSSHRCISYAVFCLKKKKRRDRLDTEASEQKQENETQSLYYPEHV